MISIGQQVIYGTHGVCTVTGQESMRFGKKRENYFVLQPNAQPDARFYVPAENEVALAKLKPLMTKQMLLELLHSPEVRAAEWIPEENQRKLRYKELLAGGDRAQLLGMIQCLYRHKEELQQAGRKFHQSDEAFLQEAQKLLNAEFAQVFGLEAGQVSGFIRKELQYEA